MNRILNVFFPVVVAALLFSSCNKGPGEGGTSTIQGYVKLVYHPDDDFTLTPDTLAASKTDVFIVYGNEAYFGDDVETGADGLYQFEYLLPGDYTVYAYSTLPTGEKEAVSQSVTLDRGATVQVPTLYIHEGKAYGTSIVKGQVVAAYYVKDDGAWMYHSEGPAYEQRVYIRRVGEEVHFDDVRTGVDGKFAFQKLLPGEYEVFTVTEDADEMPSLVSQTVSVGEAGKIYGMESPFVIRINL